MSTTFRFNYGDYLQLPEDRRYEIIDGDLFVVPAPIPYHQRVSRNIAFLLHSHVMAGKLGEVLYAPCDLLLSEFDIVQPDIFYISRDRLTIIREKYIEAAPDLVIEILSEGTKQRDRGIKQKLYGRAGVREYWLVDPAARTIEVMTLDGRDYRSARVYRERETLHSSLLPDLAIALADVF